MEIFNKNRQKKGYSLAELLTVVAIVGILCAITVVGVGGYYKHLKQLEMDQTAKEIYIAAQNHLTYAETTGELAELDSDTLGDKMLSKPFDMEDADWNEDDYYYLVYNPSDETILDNTLLKEMLPMGAIDGTVREAGSYIIEYNLKNATVYGVFYTKKGQENQLTAADETGRFLPGNAYRGSPKERMKAQKDSGKKFLLGYYGGSAVNLERVKKIEAPIVEILNGDQLIVKVTDTNTIKTNSTLEVTGETSHAKKLIPLKETTAKKENGKKIYTVTLDDITTKGQHFAELFAETAAGKADGFTPGEDITITVKAVGKEVLTPIVTTKPIVTNSLFNSVTTKNDEDGNPITIANISALRHLENLDPSISGMAEDAITDASQLASTQVEFADKMGISLSVTGDDQLDYTIFKEVVGSPFNIYKKGEPNASATNSYYSITNNHLTSYNGNKFQIKNLHIKDQANAGLFSKITLPKPKTMTISNVTLWNPMIEGTQNVGAIAGAVSKGSQLTLQNVSVDCDTRKHHILGDGNAELRVGGLVGLVDSDWKQKGAIIAIKNSFVRGENLTVYAIGYDPTVGGLIGLCKNNTLTTIDNTYSTALVESRSHGVGSTRRKWNDVYAGGLVGRIIQPQKDSKISNSYVGGHTKDGGKYHKKTANIVGDNTHSSSPNANNISVGGLIGALEPNQNKQSSIEIDNCYTTASVKGINNKSDYEINLGGLIGRVGRDHTKTEGNLTAKIGNSYATGLVLVENSDSNKENEKLGSFIGRMNQGQSNTLQKTATNYILSGINPSKIDIIGNDKESNLAEKASAVTIGAKKMYTAHPYDKKLNPNKFQLRPVIDDTHYGDWPEASNQITKEISDNSNKNITQTTLANQGMSFVLTNTTKHKKYTVDYDSFSKNADGTYSGSFSLPEDEFDPTDQFTMNELAADVEGTYSEKSFTLFASGNKVAESTTDEESIKFTLEKGNDLEIKVTNKYFDLINVVFQYFNQTTNTLTQIETKKFKPNDTVDFSTLIDASVDVPSGKVFNGIWLLTDKKGIPKEPQVRINQLGEVVDQSGNPTGDSYQLLASETEVYVTAEFENIPVITLQYGVMTNGVFTPIIADQVYQVNKGSAFDATIAIKNILNNTYIFKSVSEKGASVNATVHEDTITFNVQNIQQDHTYQVVVEGKSTKYRIKYVFLNSNGTSINNLVYDRNAPSITVEDVEYRGAVIDSGKELDGVVDMFTNVALSDLDTAPEGFNQPTWTNIKLKNNQENIVYVIYARKKYNVNYNLDGGKSQKGNYWIPRKEFEFASQVLLQDAPTKLGYDFQGWQVTDSQNNPIAITNQNFTMPNSDVTVTAVWQEKEYADYTIEFYLEKVSDKPDLADHDKSYDYCKSVTIKNKNVGQVPNLHQDYAEFNNVTSIFGNKYQQYYSYNQTNTANALTNTTVKADGSTIVKVYFDREVITMNFMYASAEEARQAAREYGGASATVEASYEFIPKSNAKAEREYMGWFYWKNRRYVKITEDTVLPDNEPVYFRYHWVGETYVETTFKFYKTHVWKWDKTEGNWGMWRFGYYERTPKQNNVVYKGLYGAPFIQEGSKYYQFGWNNNKNWVAHFGSILNISAEELNYYDSFTLPKEEGKVLMLHANPKDGNYYKVVHYVQQLEPLTEWESKFVMSSGNDFKYTFVDQFQGFSVEGYNDTNYFSGNVLSPSILNVPSGGNYEVSDSPIDRLNVFHRRKQYDLIFKNVKNISNELVYYQSNINPYLQQNLDQSYIPSNIDSDYLFDGWYDSMSEDANPIDTNMQMPAGSYIAFAHWKAPEYRVTLHYKENPEISEWSTSEVAVDKYQTSQDNSEFAQALNKSQTVTNQDYQFKQWYYDEHFEQIYNVGDPIIEDTQLYAKYTQTGGTKTVKVRYVCGSDAQGNVQYFQVDQDGHVQYEADGKTPKITTESTSYFEISGEFGTITTLTPQIISGYKPASSHIAVKFDEDTDEVDIQYTPVETWNYTIKCMLKNGWKDIELASFNKDTYYNQIVEYAPEFAGFKLVDREAGFAMMNQQDKNHQHKFYYQIDPNYEFKISGDYQFASNNYGVTNYDGTAHEISLKAQDLAEFPSAIVVTTHYYKDSDGQELSSAPIEVGQYYAIINVAIGKDTLFSNQVELEIQ